MTTKVWVQLVKLFKAASLADWIMAASTVCLLAVAVIAASISYFQWHEMHTGGVDTHELAQAAKAQADATKAEADSMRDLANRALRQAEATDKLAQQAEKSAEASIRSAQDADISARSTKSMAGIAAATLENMKQSEHLDQRPWLSITGMRLTKFQVGSKVETQVSFSNSGRSPALRVSVASAVVILDSRTDPHFLEPAASFKSTALRALAPQSGNIATKDSERSIDADEKERIEHFSRIIWYWGFIRYEDTFGESHVTQFCGYTKNDGVDTQKVMEGMDLHLCPDENGMS